MTESHNGHRTAPVTRIAAVGDLHCTVDSKGRLRELFARASQEADVIALCGDLTDYGLPDEARVLVGELGGARVPVVGVLGNHDHESGKQVEIAQILTEAGMKVLDGDAVQLAGIGFAGTKGFSGGFDIHSLGAWGEVATKAFVQTAIDEAMKLEAGLARLRTRSRVALLHYSPISGTVIGETPVRSWSPAWFETSSPGRVSSSRTAVPTASRACQANGACWRSSERRHASAARAAVAPYW